ncbi:MAG: FAD-binding oxidoreductase [Austwickia sp.]|nr:MAG: FAD-binding oxidoreductase [Austwickia sp.]
MTVSTSQPSSTTAPAAAPRPASFDAVERELRTILGEAQVKTRPLDLARMSHDASHFLLRPQAVVVARNGDDVASALRVATRHGVPVTFRSGGTSLSGQAGTDGVLIDTRMNFRGIHVLDDGARVRCQPGATIRAVNARLAPHRLALGPDPASEIACTVGGVVANNSSGMACGTTANTYQTLDGLRFALLSGTVVDTSEADADARFKHDEPALWEGIARLRDRIRGNDDSVRRIRHQFSMKNTMGYGLNSFLDHDEPAQILAHLMVGSEGTLGFIIAATFRTVPVYPHAATALLVFDAISHATDALPALIDAGARTAELMDAASLRVAQAGAKVVPQLVGLDVRAHTALLVELQEEQHDALAERLASVEPLVRGLGGLAAPGVFTTDPGERATAWHVRKGLYTAVAGARPTGTTAMLEDLVVPMPALTDTVRNLADLCARHRYEESVIFGHARDANLHFMITADLADPTQVDRFAAFTEDMVDLVLDANGSLKAEHGTGRIMAPYVRRQYGDELYAVMVELKALLDPGGTLNPGVIISDDATAHLKNLKVSAPVGVPPEEAPNVDKCVECGYCEPVCPSRDVTTTPRQRIALMRDMASAGEAERAAIAKDFGYDAVDTCAVDSLCLLNCPVAIDTGKLMKTQRAARQNATSEEVGRLLAVNWGKALTLLRGGVGIADAVPPAVLTGATGAARTVLPTDLVPLVGDDLPGPGVSRRTASRHEPGDVVLFPSCMGELFGPAGEGVLGRKPMGGAAFAFLTLCDRAGVAVTLPRGVEERCCGTVWRSKGMRQGLHAMAVRTARTLLEASDEGRLPVVTEASSCSHGLHELVEDLRHAGEGPLADRLASVRTMDAVRYVADHVLDKLTTRRTLYSMVVHPTCSDRHAGDVEALVAVANRCATTVVVPTDAGCCGFAGDRGMLHPELTAAATRAEAREATTRPYDAYVSTNRTCEIGMTRATGHTYRHVLEVLEEVTR